MTTRAGGLVASIGTPLLRHGVCLCPVRSRVNVRTRGDEVRVTRKEEPRPRDAFAFAKRKPRRKQRAGPFASARNRNRRARGRSERSLH